MPSSSLLASELRRFSDVYWYWRRTPPEASLLQMLANYPSPFIEMEPGIWELKFYTTWFLVGLVLTLFSVPLSYLCIYLSEKLEAPMYQLMPWLLLLLSACILATNVGVRRLRLDHTRGEYKYYIGGSLRVREPIYNLYIRLIGQKKYPGGSKASNWFFYLSINGVGLDELKLTAHTEFEYRMRKLGRRLARHLDLNYFDYVDESPYHDIRHRPEDLCGSKQNLNQGINV